MNITLKRTLKLQRCTLLAKTIIRTPRPDVVELLKATRDNPDKMPPRLLTYLQREGLWTKETNVLTAKADSVLNTGMLATAERGIYHVWFSQGDPLLGTRPVLIQRATAKWSESWNKASRVSADSMYAISDAINVCFHDGGGQETLVLESMVPEVTKAPDKTANMQLSWIVTDVQSEINITGQLELLAPAQKFASNKPRNERLESVEIRLTVDDLQVSTLLDNLAEQLGHQWNRDCQRALAKLPSVADQITLCSIAQHQLSEITTSRLGTFDSVFLEDYPLMPCDQTVAQQWHIRWLEHQFESRYTSPTEVHAQQQAFLDQPAMKPYLITPLQGQELLNQISRHRAPASFWHIAAMQDLNPTRQQPRLTSFTYKLGSEFDLDKFIQRMKQEEPVTFCLYADRHYKTSRHARNLVYIQSALGAQRGRVLTSAEDLPNVPENWQIEEMAVDKSNHDRYWVFVTASRTICWKCTTSLDFIRQSNDTYLIDSNVSFVPIPEDQLPDFLEQILDTRQGEAA